MSTLLGSPTLGSPGTIRTPVMGGGSQAKMLSNTIQDMDSDAAHYGATKYGDYDEDEGDEEDADAPMPPELSRKVCMLKFIYFLSGVSGKYVVSVLFIHINAYVNVFHVRFCISFYLRLCQNTASTWGRFGAIYYTDKGMTADQIGLLEGIMPAVACVCIPLWGVAADLTRNKKVVAIICYFFSTAILMLLAFPSIATGYEVILLISIGTSVFSAGNIVDAYTFDVLGNKYRKRYGQIRLWAGLSWGMGAMGMGYLSDAFGFDINFILYGSLAFISLGIFIFLIPGQTKQEESTTLEDVQCASLGRALCNGPTLFYFFEMVVFGAGMGVVEKLLFVYIKRDLNGSTSLCGNTVMLTVLFELPIFYFGEQLLNQVGHNGLFLIAMLFYIFRVYGYTLLTEDTKDYILLLELCHGMTFGCMYTAAQEYARVISPREWLGTMQNIVNVVLYCIGGGSGAIVGGWVFETYGPRPMYKGAAYIVSGVFVLHLCAMCLCDVGQHQYAGHSFTSAAKALPDTYPDAKRSKLQASSSV